MKKIIILSLIACFGCLKEENADPGLPDTFVRYFNGGFNDEAQDIKITSDGGYLMLATTTVRINEVTSPYYKIKIIKADRYGNQMWQKIYPPYGPPAANGQDENIDSVSFRGRSLAIVRDASGMETGYVVVGDSIHARANSQSHLLIMLTDINGDSINAKTLKPNFPVQGKGIVINSNGTSAVTYTVLAAAENPQLTKNMYLAELASDLSIMWQRTYGAGESVLTNRLFSDQNFYYISGTVKKQSGSSNIRFLRTPADTENTERDLEIGDPIFSETGNDMCAYGFGFAVTGTSNENGDDDILFKRLAQDGRELKSNLYGFPGQSETGLSICQARDGGLVLLGSVNSHVQSNNSQVGRGGKDYFLIKINAFGDEEWRQVFGSKNDDIGASVLATADGSYVIFGTTLWGGLRTLSLIKTDTKGNIE